MKKSVLFISMMLMVLASVSCSSSRKLVSMTDKEQEVAITLSGPKYCTDKEYWRAVQSGVSSDVSMAKKVAIQNARQELAAMVEHELKMVIENYGKNATVNPSTENATLYEELARTVVNRRMSGVELVEEKAFRQTDGNYRYHVCLQLSKEEVVSEAVNLLSEEERLRLEFDKERFKKIFEEEMAALKNN